MDKERSVELRLCMLNESYSWVTTAEGEEMEGTTRPSQNPENESESLPSMPATHSSFHPISSTPSLKLRFLLNTASNKTSDSLRFKHRLLLVDTRIPTIDTFTDPLRTIDAAGYLYPFDVEGSSPPLPPRPSFELHR
nr:hypothetical protein L203_02592 [Cryptococcus depauperatus CBS 7841]